MLIKNIHCYIIIIIIKSLNKNELFDFISKKERFNNLTILKSQNSKYSCPSLFAGKFQPSNTKAYVQ